MRVGEAATPEGKPQVWRGSRESGGEAASPEVKPRRRRGRLDVSGKSEVCAESLPVALSRARLVKKRFLSDRKSECYVEMGNAGGKEEVENGGDDPAERSDGDSSYWGGGVGGGSRRSRSVEAMGGSPPESPGRSRSPLMFAPQVPVAPLQRASDIPPVFNQYWMSDPYIASDAPREKGIPMLISWNYGGNNVLVEGSWDNWTSRKTLQRSGKDHSILMVLPSGVYQYRFIVDGQWRYVHELPSVANEMGHFNNIIDVNEYVPEDLQSVSEFESPPSPDSSYSRPFPVDEDFAKEPPAVPPQLHLTVLGTQKPEGAFIRPQHVVLNHLFIEKGWSSQSLVPLAYTHRFQSKYVTVVLYKPVRR